MFWSSTCFWTLRKRNPPCAGIVFLLTLHCSSAHHKFPSLCLTRCHLCSCDSLPSASTRFELAHSADYLWHGHSWFRLVLTGWDGRVVRPRLPARARTVAAPRQRPIAREQTRRPNNGNYGNLRLLPGKAPRDAETGSEQDKVWSEGERCKRQRDGAFAKCDGAKVAPATAPPQIQLRSCSEATARESLPTFPFRETLPFVLSLRFC